MKLLNSQKKNSLTYHIKVYRCVLHFSHRTIISTLLYGHERKQIIIIIWHAYPAISTNTFTVQQIPYGLNFIRIAFCYLFSAAHLCMCEIRMFIQ